MRATMCHGVYHRFSTHPRKAGGGRAGRRLPRFLLGGGPLRRFCRAPTRCNRMSSSRPGAAEVARRAMLPDSARSATPAPPRPRRCAFARPLISRPGAPRDSLRLQPVAAPARCARRPPLHRSGVPTWSSTSCWPWPKPAPRPCPSSSAPSPRPSTAVVFAPPLPARRTLARESPVVDAVDAAHPPAAARNQ